MNMYQSIYTDEADGTYRYLTVTRHGKLEDYGFKTAEEAAWECDKARLAIGHLLRRKRSYNFPERIKNISESEMQNVSRAVLVFLNTHGHSDINLGPTGLTEEQRAMRRIESTPVVFNVEEANRIHAEQSKRESEELCSALTDILAELQDFRLRIEPLDFHGKKPLLRISRDLLGLVTLGIDEHKPAHTS